MEPRATFQLTEEKRDRPVWKLAVFEERLVFEAPDGTTRTLPHAQRAKLDYEWLATFAIVKLTLDRKLQFKKDAAVQKALLDWLGPPTEADLRTALHVGRFGLPNLISGIVLIACSTPWVFPAWLGSDDPGIEPLGFELLLLTWGGGNLLLHLASRLKVHRGWFVVDCVFQLAIGGWMVVEVVAGQRHTFWLGLAFLSLIGIAYARRQYRRFAQLASS